MSLVNYESGSSDDENEDSSENIVVTRRINPPASRPTSDENQQKNVESSSSLLSDLPKFKSFSGDQNRTTDLEIPEDELEDIVRAENKVYAKDLPEKPKQIKRKRDGPVKIFLPTIEQDSDDEDKPKKKIQTGKKNCALLNALPAPIYDEDAPSAPLVEIKPPSEKTPQVSATGLFIPYTVSKKQTNKIVSATNIIGQADEEEDDDDDDDQIDFLGLNKNDQIQVSNLDVESVLRETLPKAQVATATKVFVEEPTNFVDLDEEDQTHQEKVMINDDDELLRFLPKNERYKEIKNVHIDSMLGDAARLQLLKNCTEERETMLKQAAIQVPKGEVRKRAQITYLIAKAQADDLKLNNMWSEQKLTKRQTQAKYGF